MSAENDFAGVEPADAKSLSHADLVARLALEEKCALLSGAGTFRTRALPRLGIPGLWLSDGPHGLRKQAGAADHLGLNPSLPATCFPTACTVANSWNPSLGRQIGRALGEEAVAQGVGVVLGPGLNIKRNPLCGRNFEYFSEDPLLSGRMACSYVRGIQGRGVAACPKHFAANSQELRRMASDSAVDERTLRELYLRAFEIVVREGSPRSIMSAYNKVNGTYANESEWLLDRVLREEWGFRGAVVTDWGGSNDHVRGVKAGSTLEMPAPGGDSVRQLIGAVRRGELDEDVVDRRVDELLELVLSSDAALRDARGGFDADEHHGLARQAATQGIVLLKNEGGALPIASGPRVAVIGDFANRPRFQGAGSSAVNATRVDSILGLLGSSGLNCIGYEPGFDRAGEARPDLAERAVRLASGADVALVCLGLPERLESEGADRADMRLPAEQVELLHAVRAVATKVVVVLFCGSPVETPWRDECDALVLAGLGGQAGAGAVVDVLSGAACPSGKLAETWPERYEDVPSRGFWPGTSRTAEYREGLYVGYRYYDTAGVAVAFPFGFGLSYTEFSYSDARVEETDERGLPRVLSVVVTNEGAMAGAEVVQVYAAKPKHKVFRPAQQLCGFARVELVPGEARRVSVELDAAAMSYWDVQAGEWRVEPGEYELRVASSSRDVRLVVRAGVKGAEAPNPYAGVDVSIYESGLVAGATASQFEALYGKSLPPSRPRIDQNMTLGELNHGRSPIGWLVWAVMTNMLRDSGRAGSPDLNILFAYNMPLRALAKMTGGLVSLGMVEGMVWELRGLWVVGLARVLVEFLVNLVKNAALERRLRGGEGAR